MEKVKDKAEKSIKSQVPGLRCHDIEADQARMSRAQGVTLSHVRITK